MSESAGPTPGDGQGRTPATPNGADVPRWPSTASDASSSAAAPPRSGPVPPTRRSRRAADPAQEPAPAPVAPAHGAAAPTHGAAGPGGPEASSAADPDATAEVGGAPGRRRRLLLIGGLVAAVLVVAGGVTAYVLTRAGTPASVGAPPAVVLPSPTSTVTAAQRPATTPFASALPSTLLQYALAASADDEAWLAANAVEAYTETYTDGESGTVEVQAGQWETAEEAESVRASQAATLPTAAGAGAGATPEATDDATAAGTAEASTVLLQGDVLVGGRPTGTVTVVDLGDGTGVALWSNGTTVFRVTGPADEIRNLYAAYPL